MALPAFERHQAGVVASLDVTRSAGGAGERRVRGDPAARAPRRLVDGFGIPAHVLDRHRGGRRAGVDPPAARRASSCATTGSASTADGGVVLATDVSAVAAHLAGARRRAAPPSTPPIGSWR